MRKTEDGIAHEFQDLAAVDCDVETARELRPGAISTCFEQS
jgi:hypothetical protein